MVFNSHVTCQLTTILIEVLLKLKLLKKQLQYSYCIIRLLSNNLFLLKQEITFKMIKKKKDFRWSRLWQCIPRVTVARFVLKTVVPLSPLLRELSTVLNPDWSRLSCHTSLLPVWSSWVSGTILVFDSHQHPGRWHLPCPKLWSHLLSPLRAGKVCQPVLSYRSHWRVHHILEAS